MKHIFSLIFIVMLLGGCAHFDPAAPRNEREAFPVRNQDPRWGVVINKGTAHLEFLLKDEAGRPIEHGFMAGAGRFFTINGQSLPHYWIRQLDVGNYKLELIPFYYQTDLTNPLFGLPIRYRRDLQRQKIGFRVGRNPTLYYDYRLGRHFGWLITVNGGYVPDTAHGLPGVRINLQGNFR